MWNGESLLYRDGQLPGRGEADLRGGNLHPQAIRKSNQTYKDGAIGFAFPAFDGTVPRIVRNFVGSNEFQADYFFAVTTYGIFPGARWPCSER